ncbi:MAG: tetratricopeptide repeat protein [Anaerolineales bacterium]|nr:tetratricopeptide repeat protein [Anaerolineales bacterium]
MRLAIFHGPFTAERAAQMMGATLQNIRVLLDQSLLQKSGPGRYQIHALLRQYALEQLADDPPGYRALYEDYCRGYLLSLADYELGLKSSAQIGVLEEMAYEYENLIDAWDWAIANGRIDWMVGGCEGLCYYFELRGLHEEGIRFCQKNMDCLVAAGLCAQNICLWITLGIWGVLFRTLIFRFEESQTLVLDIQDKLTLADRLGVDARREQGRLRLVIGAVTLWGGLGRQQALACYQHGLRLLYDTENPWDISLALAGIAECHDQLGNIALCQRFSEEGLAIQAEIGDPHIINRLVMTLGYSHMLAGDYQAGLRLVQEQNAYRQKINQQHWQVESLAQLGLAMHHAGQFEQSSILCRQAIAAYTLPEDFLLRSFFKSIVACNDLCMGNYAAVMSEAAWLGEPKWPYYEATLGFLKGWVRLLGPDVLALEGREVTPDLQRAEQEMQSYLALNRALPRFDMQGFPLAILAYIAYRRGNMELARKRLIEALESGIQQQYYAVQHTSLAILALILGEHGQYETALELYRMAESHPFIGNSLIYADLFGKPIAHLAIHLSEETLAAVSRHAQEKDLTRTVEAYLAMLHTGGWNQVLAVG